MTITQNHEEFLELAADSASVNGEVVMLNLLNFRRVKVQAPT